MTHALVVLAAGLGRRYGGAKQLDPVGPDGATLMDYALYDAHRAGFERAVIVARPDMAAALAEWSARWTGTLDVAVAYQRLDDLPPGRPAPAGRAKPWGTAHALLTAAPHVGGPCAVVNADDFYGRGAYAAAAGFLAGQEGATGRWALVGYRLCETLTPHGGVNRGVCRVDADGTISSIDEVTDICVGGDVFGGRSAEGPVTLGGSAPVSMNFWAFTPDVFTVLRDGFARFLAGADAEAEYLLPIAVQEAIRGGIASVRLLPAGDRWFGMTHPADRPAVAAALASLHASGAYPDLVGA